MRHPRRDRLQRLLLALFLVALAACGGSRKTSTPGGSTYQYLPVYDSGLQGAWSRSCWEDSPGALPTDFSATPPAGRSGTAIHVQFGAWNAFGLANRPGGDWNRREFLYLNEARTLEFDVLFEAGGTGLEQLTILLQDADLSDDVRLVDLIPGWASMSDAQKFGTWFHVTVDLAAIHPTVPRFDWFGLFNGGALTPRLYLSDVKVGWRDDTAAPVVTPGAPVLAADYRSLTLPFTTSPATLYRVEYGIGNTGQTVQGAADDWAASHAPVLTGLTPGSTYQYRLVALSHRMDASATPVPGVYSGSYVIPPVPTAPPAITGLAVSELRGNRATLSWTTNRPCAAHLSYAKAGGGAMTRELVDLQPSRVTTLDLLEPSTAYSTTVTVTDAFALSTSQVVAFTTGASTAASVTITAYPASAHAISPWIYGVNSAGSHPEMASANLTLNRRGGNRWTAYNWENNASNAGADYGPYSNDSYLGGGETPGEAVRSVIEADRALGMASVMTVQLQGWVAADKAGLVNANDAGRFGARLKQVVYRKGAAFTETPSTSDASVYMDEFLWAIRQKLLAGGDIFAAGAALPTFVSLDNEPDLWFDTHGELQTGQIAPATFITHTVELARALKDVAPGVKLLGPVNFGFSGLASWGDVPGTSYDESFWFVDDYLQALQSASTTAGRRLLDVYTFHWYSEARDAGGTRIGSLTGPSLTDDQVQAIVQSPRSLWDPTYSENSWIQRWFGAPVRILDRLRQKIDAGYPGTGLAITEYDNGGGRHIAGGIAQADNLGIYGQSGLVAASYWYLQDGAPFVAGAFKMFRNFDGANSTFGDTSIPAASSDTARVSAYLSQDSAAIGRKVLVVINRSTATQDVAFNGLAASGTARVYRIDASHSDPYLAGEVPANLASFVLSVPALTVSTIELR